MTPVAPPIRAAPPAPPTIMVNTARRLSLYFEFIVVLLCDEVSPGNVADRRLIFRSTLLLSFRRGGCGRRGRHVLHHAFHHLIAVLDHVLHLRRIDAFHHSHHFTAISHHPITASHHSAMTSHH